MAVLDRGSRVRDAPPGRREVLVDQNTVVDEAAAHAGQPHQPVPDHVDADFRDERVHTPKAQVRQAIDAARGDLAAAVAAGGPQASAELDLNIVAAGRAILRARDAGGDEKGKDDEE